MRMYFRGMHAVNINTPLNEKMKPRIRTLGINILIVWCLAATVGEQVCPDARCSCNQDPVQVSCERQYLSRLPTPLPENITVLNMNHNGIKTIQSDTFSQYESLKVITFERNGLHNVEPYSFRGFSGDRISLRHNRITKLVTHSFGGIRSANLLYLLNNLIDTIEPSAFEGSSNIDELSLRGNPLRHIANDAFKGLWNVKDLDLSNCGITRVKTNMFHGLHNVQSIYLSYNANLTVIEEKAFFGLDDIKRITLENSGVNLIQPRAFEGFGAHFNVTMNFQNNKIKTFHCSTFDRLSGALDFNFKNNPFVCDCRLSWVVQETDARHLSTVTCVSPRSVMSRDLNDLSVDDLPCYRVTKNDGCVEHEKRKLSNVLSYDVQQHASDRTRPVQEWPNGSSGRVDVKLLVLFLPVLMVIS